MKKERFLLLTGNYYPELTGIGKYSGEMALWLLARGYDCGVVTTFPYYPSWKRQSPYAAGSFRYKKEKLKKENGGLIITYRCPHYIPSIPTGKKRILSDLTFFISAAFQIFLLLFKKKYDYVISVAPPFQLGLLALLYKKIKGAEVIYHVQDLQIDAAFELGMIKSKRMVDVMFRIENFILRNSDYISTISQGMMKKIKAKGCRDVLLFPNWVETSLFHPLMDKESLKERFGFSSKEKIVLYSGAIGEKQGLEILLDSAKYLSFRSDIKIVICGEGPYKEKLVSEAQKMLLGNVIFMPLQPLESFNAFLNMADLHLVLQRTTAHDLVMPSKLTTILSIGGTALVTAEPDTSLFEVINSNKIGLLVEPENTIALTECILRNIEQPCEELQANARNYAEQFLRIDSVINSFLNDIKFFKATKVGVKVLNKEEFQLN